MIVRKIGIVLMLVLATASNGCEYNKLLKRKITVSYRFMILDNRHIQLVKASYIVKYFLFVKYLNKFLHKNYLLTRGVHD